MNIPRRIAIRLFAIPTVILAISVGLSFVLKPLSERLAGGANADWAQPILSYGILVMLAGYALAGVWLMVGMWRFLSWARGDLQGDCPQCKGQTRVRADGSRKCSLCGFQRRA